MSFNAAANFPLVSVADFMSIMRRAVCRPSSEPPAAFAANSSGPTFSTAMPVIRLKSSTASPDLAAESARPKTTPVTAATPPARMPSAPAAPAPAAPSPLKASMRSPPRALVRSPMAVMGLLKASVAVCPKVEIVSPKPLTSEPARSVVDWTLSAMRLPAAEAASAAWPILALKLSSSDRLAWRSPTLIAMSVLYGRRAEHREHLELREQVRRAVDASLEQPAHELRAELIQDGCFVRLIGIAPAIEHHGVGLRPPQFRSPRAEGLNLRVGRPLRKFGCGEPLI